MMPRMQIEVPMTAWERWPLDAPAPQLAHHTIPSKRLTQSHSIMCTRSQSGQIQVGPLLMPHLFSSKQSGQI